MNGQAYPECIIQEDKINNCTTSPTIEHNDIIHFLKLPTRTRTISETDRIASGPSFKGRIDNFCRNQGHGEIVTSDGEKIFLHISDIDSDWCPAPGDVVSFKKALMPPKRVKYQAVHCKLIHLSENQKHEHWN